MSTELTIVKQPENWIHYSSSSATILMKTKIQQLADKDAFFMKPKGLWITPEYANYNWFEWSTSEEFRQGDLNFVHDVKFSSDARLLRLENAADIDAFTQTYGFSIMDHFGLRSFSRRNDGIYWDRVADQYQGILIPTYIWERRLMAGADWYYPWDCACGCIWDAAAVESITVRSLESAGYVTKEVNMLLLQASIEAHSEVEKNNV